MKIFPHFRLPAIKLPEVHPAVNAAGLAAVLGNAAAFALSPQGQTVMHGIPAHDAQIASLVAGGVLAFLPAKKSPPPTAQSSIDIATLLQQQGVLQTMNGFHIDLTSILAVLAQAESFLAGKPVTIPVEPQKIKLGNYDVTASLTTNGVQLQYAGEAQAQAPAAVTVQVEATHNGDAKAPDPHA